MQAEADELRGQNQQLNKQFAAASTEVKALKTQVRHWGYPEGYSGKQVCGASSRCAC